MFENDDDFYYDGRGSYPCDDCLDTDHCDGWDKQFCCALCRWSGGGYCEDCDPFDI